MMKRARTFLVFLAFTCFAASSAFANARYVVVVVWDGMRPDMVGEDTTPTLSAMMKLGTTFASHHASFISADNTNCAVLATGSYPRTSGILADEEYRPNINAQAPVPTDAVETIRLGDAISGGKYLSRSTLAEIIRNHQPPLKTNCAGTEQTIILADRAVRSADSPSSLISGGNTLPPPSAGQLKDDLGIFPAITGNNKTMRDNWTTAALVDDFWKESVPSFTMLWLAEPYFSQDYSGIGTFHAQESILNCDEKLSMVLASLNQKGILEETDVIVLSDHGFTNVTKHVDLTKDLKAAGIDAVAAFEDAPIQDAVVVVNQGAAALLYVTGHEAPAVAKAVEALRKLDYIGVIFTRDGANETFPLSLAKLDSAEAPDIVVSYRWDEKGTPAGLAAGKGTSGSLSPTDMHSMMVAMGPDFKKSFRNETPSGNTDIAPTILWILGMDAPAKMDGRVLTEAMTIPAPEMALMTTTRHEKTAATPSGTWTQYLKVSEVNGTEYIEDGNSSAAKASEEDK